MSKYYLDYLFEGNVAGAKKALAEKGETLARHGVLSLFLSRIYSLDTVDALINEGVVINYYDIIQSLSHDVGVFERKNYNNNNNNNNFNNNFNFNTYQKYENIEYDEDEKEETKKEVLNGIKNLCYLMLHPDSSKALLYIKDDPYPYNYSEFEKVKKFMLMFKSDIVNMLRKLNIERMNILSSASKRFLDFLVEVYGKESAVDILNEVMRSSALNRRKHLLSALNGPGAGGKIGGKRRKTNKARRRRRTRRV